VTTDGYRRRCPDCGLIKPASDFPRNRSTGDGLGCYCKPCHNTRTRATINRLYKGSSRHYHLKKKYGIGAAEVDRMAQEQGGVCAVCKSRPATQVDHDHKTGVVRGILCIYCNAAMGAFRDNPLIIANAIEYLESHSA
jgi:hypothetical protein